MRGQRAETTGSLDHLAGACRRVDEDRDGRTGSGFRQPHRCGRNPSPC